MTAKWRQQAAVFFDETGAQVGHRLVTQALRLPRLGVRLGEGSGAGAVVPLLRRACLFHNPMAIFDEAGVSRRP